MKSYINLKTLALIGIFTFTLACGKNPVIDELPDPKNDLLVKSNVITSSFLGNGVQWGGYDILQTWTGSPTLSEADWNTLYQRVRFMRPPVVRIMVNDGWNYVANNTFDPLKSQHVLFKILDFCEAEGITVMFGEWGHGGGTGINQTWLEQSSQFLEYLVNTKNYTCIKYFIMVNEPNGDWSSTNGNYPLWKSLVEQAHAKMVEKGLDAKVKILGPDIAVWDPNLVSWMLNTHADLGERVGTYDIHTYPDQAEVRNGNYQKMITAYKNATPVNKEILMAELGFKYPASSELGIENAKRIAKDPYASDDSNMFTYDSFYGVDMADAIIQCMQAGYAGSIIWDLDDAMYNINGGPSTDLKRWGFWNILGTEKFGNPADENIRPWFYPMSLLCRYFPQGSQILEVALPVKKGLRAVAALKNGKYTIAIVNSGYTPYDINLKLEAGGVLTLNKYSYVCGEGVQFTGNTDANGFAIPEEANATLDFQEGKAKVMNIPGQSFILYTNMD